MVVPLGIVGRSWSWGCHAAGHSPCLQAAGRQAQPTPRGCPVPWRCPSPGDASKSSHWGKPGCSLLLHASFCHWAGPQHGQAPHTPRPSPREVPTALGHMPGNVMGQLWESQRWVTPAGWHWGHGAVGCSPPRCLPGREAQEEPSGGAGACCAPAVPCFPSYTVQLAGCLYRLELILAALCFPLLPSPPAFPARHAPTTRHPFLPPSAGVVRQGHGCHMLDPLPTSAPPHAVCLSFPSWMMLSPGFSMVSAHWPLLLPSPVQAHVGKQQDRCWVLLSQPPPWLPPSLPGQGNTGVRAPVPLLPLPPMGRSPGFRSGAFLCSEWASARGIWGCQGKKLWVMCDFAGFRVDWGGGHALGAHARGC